MGLLLWEKDRTYLEHDRPSHLNKPTPSHIRKRDADIRNKSKKALKYLEYLANHLVPDQNEQVFNEDTILPLIHSILSKTKPDWKNNNTTYLPAILDIRLFNLAILI